MAIITISRGSLSGGELLAEQLAARLGARVISREVIVEAARQYGVSQEKLIEGLESPPGFWARLTHHRTQYTLAVAASLAQMVSDGNAIYHGLAGQILLKDLPKVIKLRLIAPMEYRIRSAMIELSLSRERAIKHIETVDDRRERWVRYMHGVEWTDPALYDMVLNLEHVSLETATDLVVALAGKKEYRRTPELERARRDFATEARVRAELALKSPFGDEVEVSVSGGMTRLSGPFIARDRADVVDFVKRVEGVDRVSVDGEVEDAPAPAGASDVKARDVMLPISSYPFIHKWLSIREAIAALATSSIQLKDGHVITPRYLLVHDENEQLVGVLARRSLLRGLTPQLEMVERARETVETKWMHPSEQQLDIPFTFRWLSLFGDAALAHAQNPVESITAPIRASVHPRDEISLVVATMLQHGVDLLPVIEDRKPVGVILMTEVFDTVAEHLMEAYGDEGAGEAPGRGAAGEGEDHGR